MGKVSYPKSRCPYTLINVLPLQMGEPEDLKGAIIFLASDASKFVTGTDLRVDGGYCII